MIANTRDINVTLYDNDVAAFKAVLVALSSLTWKGVELVDLMTRARPKFLGTGVYSHRFRAFPADISTLFEYAKGLEGEHTK